MELNEVKKLLYKTDPTAQLYKVQNGVAYYVCMDIHSGKVDNLHFHVPIVDMGDTAFKANEPAKHLIRWFAHAERLVGEYETV